MKFLVTVLSLAMSLSTLASSGETKTFVYDGSQNSIELLLRGEKTHTEYNYETRQTTCYRTEVVGYRTICSSEMNALPPRHPVPRPMPRPMPHPRPYPRYCRTVPVYGTVAYPCTQTVPVPYEVKDYDVDAKVVLDVTKLPEAVTAGEKFTVKLLGDTISLEATGSKKFFLVLNKKDERAELQGSIKYLDAYYSVELIEAAPVVKALQVNRLSVKNPVVTVDMGTTTSKYLTMSLKVVRAPLLGSDTVLFDRELTEGEVSLDENSMVNVDLSKLGVDLNGGRFLITAKAYLKVNGKVLNASQFGDLEASKTLIYKN